MRYILAGLRNKIQAACLARKTFTCEHVPQIKAHKTTLALGVSFT